MLGTRKTLVSALLSVGLLSALAPFSASAHVIPGTLMTPAPAPLASPPADAAAFELSRGTLASGLAEKNPKSPYLDEAIASYRKALAELTPASPRALTAQIKSDLANALVRHAAHTFSKDDALEAQRLADDALADVDRATNPQGWASLQELRGTCAMTAFGFDNSIETAERAIQAFQEAQRTDMQFHNERHRLWLEYKIADVRSIIVGRYAANCDYAAIENQFAAIAAGANAIHETMLTEYALSGLARTRGKHAVATGNLRLLETSVDMLQRQANRVAGSRDQAFLSYTQVNLAINELMVYRRNANPTILNRARQTYREASNRNVSVFDPNINAATALLLSFTVAQDPTMRQNFALLVESIRFDERALSAFSPQTGGPMYELLAEQLAVTSYYAGKVAPTYAESALHMRHALSAFTKAFSLAPSRKYDPMNEFYEADILGNLADIDLNLEEATASNALFATVIKNTALTKSPPGSIEEVWAQSLLRHSLRFNDTESRDRAIALLDATLASGRVRDHRYHALLRSAHASAIRLSALHTRNVDLLQQAIAERHQALDELKLVSHSSDSLQITHFLAVDSFELGVALVHHHRSSESISLLHYAVAEFDETLKRDGCEKYTYECNLLIVRRLKALDVLASQQPDDIAAVQEAVTAGHQYFASTLPHYNPHDSAWLLAALGINLDKLAKLTGNTALRGEAEADYRAALPNLDAQSGAEFIVFIHRRLEL